MSDGEAAADFALLRGGAACRAGRERERAVRERKNRNNLLLIIADIFFKKELSGLIEQADNGALCIAATQGYVDIIMGRVGIYADGSDEPVANGLHFRIREFGVFVNQLQAIFAGT